MAIGKQRRLDEALRAGISEQKIDIDKLMASTTTTILNSQIQFTPSSTPFDCCDASQLNHNSITVLEPKCKPQKPSNLSNRRKKITISATQQHVTTSDANEKSTKHRHLTTSKQGSEKCKLQGRVTTKKPHRPRRRGYKKKFGSKAIVTS